MKNLKKFGKKLSQTFSKKCEVKKSEVKKKDINITNDDIKQPIQRDPIEELKETLYSLLENNDFQDLMNSDLISAIIPDNTENSDDIVNNLTKTFPVKLMLYMEEGNNMENIRDFLTNKLPSVQSCYNMGKYYDMNDIIIDYIKTTKTLYNWSQSKQSEIEKIIKDNNPNITEEISKKLMNWFEETIKQSQSNQNQK